MARPMVTESEHDRARRAAPVPGSPPAPAPSLVPTTASPAPGGSQPSFLLVDDDETFRARLAKALISRGFDVRQAANAAQAIAAAEKDSPELAVVDLRMPGGPGVSPGTMGQSGLELVKELLRIDPSTRIVVLTGYGSITTAVEAMRLGATSYVTKPADVDDLLGAFTGKKTGEGEKAAPTTTEAFETPSLARVEWEHINRVLSDCAGNISEAARRLGIHRRSLQRKLQKRAPI